MTRGHQACAGKSRGRMSYDFVQDSAPLRGRVSVIIPSYRSESVVGEAIRSVLAQDYPIHEVIVVEDEAVADSPTARRCATFEDRVIYLTHDHGGASSARNHGAAVATGEWLAFLDADDVWEPGKLRVQMEALSENPDADFCIAAARCWSASNNRFETLAYEGSLDPHEIQRGLLVRNLFTGINSSIVIRRAAFDAIGGFASGRACEDRRLALDLFERHQAVILTEPLIRQKAGPASWRNPDRHRAEQIRLIQDYAGHFARLDPGGRLYRRAIARTHERAGMHHLENGDYRGAARDLLHSAVLWPFQPNPWRVLANALVGRLHRSRGRSHAAPM